MRYAERRETRSVPTPIRLLVLVLFVPVMLAAQAATPQSLPEGEGKALVAVACTQCHSLTPIAQMRDGRTGWKNMVEEMVLRGAQITPAEADTVVSYLLENFGPASGAFQTGLIPHGSAISQDSIETSDVTLPEAPGRELVETRCRMCHDLGRVVTVRRTPEEWERITRNMIERGPQARPEQVQAIVSYLSSQFSE